MSSCQSPQLARDWTEIGKTLLCAAYSPLKMASINTDSVLATASLCVLPLSLLIILLVIHCIQPPVQAAKHTEPFTCGTRSEEQMSGDRA